MTRRNSARLGIGRSCGLALALGVVVWSCAPSSTRPDAAAIEAEVTALMARMSLEEKVGQMIQGESESVQPADLRRYPLGSILSGGNTHPGGEKASPADRWLAKADAFFDASTDTSGGRVGIPVIWGVDAVHGNANLRGATIFPHNIGLGAARDPDLIERIGEITAREVAAMGLDWDFAPTVAVVRDDRWGRTYEGYSEDPEIVRDYAGRMVVGLQGTADADGFLRSPHVVATAKHFLGDGGTTFGTGMGGGSDRGDTRVSEEDLLRLHGQGYQAAIAADVQTIMASYSSWNGEKMHAQHHLLTEVLKEQWGFDGFVIGDWDGHEEVPGCTEESCAAAINAGVDMIMVPQSWRAFYDNTLAQVRAGEITEARVDDAVRRILRVKARAGLLPGVATRPSSRPGAADTAPVGSAAHRAVAREAVRKSLVLLKNNGELLPLARDLDVLVAGHGADDIPRQTGGWSVTWQNRGDNTNADFVGATSIYAGIQEVVTAGGGTATLSVDGSFTDAPDVAIVVFGEEPYAEMQGDIETLSFSARYAEPLQLLQRLQAQGIPVVSVFLSGRPLWTDPELEASSAFVAAWLPGSEGAGVADVLFRADDGSVHHDFSGKLSFSWPAAPDQPPVNRNDAVYEPRFPYGFGMTYGEAGTAGT